MKPESLNLLAALPEMALLVGRLRGAAHRRAGAGAQRVRHRPGTAAVALLALLAPLSRRRSAGRRTDGSTRSATCTWPTTALSHLLKLCAYVAVGVTLLYGGRYMRDRGLDRGEFYTLALFALLGQMVMISANNLLVLYLGLELMSLSLYALVAMRRDDARASEAAMKYFVLGALASGFLLYGMSMIYGGTGSLDLPDIAKAFSAAQTNRIVLVFGVVFIVAGLAFKFGAVPFHMWVPDVYQGTPTAATLLIAGAPKLAAFAIAFRLLGEALIGVAADWQQMLLVLAVLSLALGNLVAIAQTNLKRMLAYSTIVAGRLRAARAACRRGRRRRRTPTAPTGRRCST